MRTSRDRLKRKKGSVNTLSKNWAKKYKALMSKLRRREDKNEVK